MARIGKLTVKQQKFADYYIELGNGTEAAIKAGYSQKSARTIAAQNLEKPEIREYIEQRMAEKDSQRIASQDEILEFLTSVMRGEKTEETLRGIGEGAQTIDDIEVSAKDRIKAAELLGKRHMMWTEKQRIEANVGVTIIDDTGDDDEDDD